MCCLRKIVLTRARGCFTLGLMLANVVIDVHEGGHDNSLVGALCSNDTVMSLSKIPAAPPPCTTMNVVLEYVHSGFCCIMSPISTFVPALQ